MKAFTHELHFSLHHSEPQLLSSPPASKQWFFLLMFFFLFCPPNHYHPDTRVYSGRCALQVLFSFPIHIDSLSAQSMIISSSNGHCEEMLSVAGMRVQPLHYLVFGKCSNFMQSCNSSIVQLCHLCSWWSSEVLTRWRFTCRILLD